MQEVTFHEFIYFNQYIVCFFNEILSTVPSNKNVCVICIKMTQTILNTFSIIYDSLERYDFVEFDASKILSFGLMVIDLIG